MQFKYINLTIAFIIAITLPNRMDVLQAIILGTVQGITEWLPISSEGINSLILTTFYNQTLADAIYISIWLHIGTVLAATIYFRKTILKLIKNLPHYSGKQTPYNKITNFILISLFATGLVGLPILLFGIDKLNFQGSTATAFIGLLLIITGLLQIKTKSASQKKQPTIFDSFLVGIAQGFSGLPGLSRSGLTVSTLLLRNYTAQQALTLSFLISIPTILGAEIILILTSKVLVTPQLIIATITAFVTGLLSIHIFMRMAQKINFGYFCIFLGLISMIPLLL